MTEASSGKIVRFGVFEADLASGELRKNGTRIRLQEETTAVESAKTEIKLREERLRSLDEVEITLQGSDGKEWLYDLASDPRELADVRASEPGRAAELRSRLEAWEKTFTPAESTDGPELDEEIRRRLADLGYIED